ncbi:hypothetical protein GCM10009846_08220 [Agrococcus versicolor]|uniref:4'-phosphopantetheinyl transferase domain-containing protein n=1 Tax=Agrococcus versicolor TaxID=501482 RepID=A0ABN3ALL6_9MICO
MTSAPTGTSIRWLPAAVATVDALRAMGADAAGHACPRCGSDAHGIPWARSGDMRLAASASRHGDLLLVATRPLTQGALGVDVESADAVVDAAVVLHPDERGVDPAWAWVAKEAIVKRLGTGLRTDPASLRLADFAVHRLEAPAGLVAALCLGPASEHP